MGLVKYCSISLVVLLGMPISLVAQADDVIQWAGCGITKKAFMAELAKAYTAKTGINVKLSGGGASHPLLIVMVRVYHVLRVCADEHQHETLCF